MILFHAGFAAFSGGYLGVDVFFVISRLPDHRRSCSRPRRRALLARPLLRAPRPPHPAGALLRAPRLRPVGARLDVAARARGLLAQASSPTVLFVSNVLLLAAADYFGPAAEHLPAAPHLEPRQSRSSSTSSSRSLLLPALALRGAAGCSRHRRPRRSPASRSPHGAGATRRAASFFLLPFRAWELGAGALAAPGPARRAAAGPPAPRRPRPRADRRRGPSPSTPRPRSRRSTPSRRSPARRSSSSSAARARRSPGCCRSAPSSASASSATAPTSGTSRSFAFARVRSIAHPSPELMLGLVLATFALAYLSWRFVEQPFRRRSHRCSPPGGRLPASGAAAALFSGSALRPATGGGLEPDAGQPGDRDGVQACTT